MDKRFTLPTDRWCEAWPMIRDDTLHILTLPTQTT